MYGFSMLICDWLTVTSKELMPMISNTHCRAEVNPQHVCVYIKSNQTRVSSFPYQIILMVRCYTDTLSLENPA